MQEEKFCNKMEVAEEFTYLGDRMSTGENIEAAMTARSRYGSAKLKECESLLY